MDVKLKTIRDIPFDPDEGTLLERLRVHPESEDGHALRTLLRRSAERIRPKAVYTVREVRARGGDAITIREVTFRSRLLSRNLAGVERVFPYVATCGVEADSADIGQANMLEQFWFDHIKELALATGRRRVREEIGKRFAIPSLASMSPGSGPQQLWPIEQQQKLFDLIGDVTGAIGVRLTESCLMIPNKSVSGFFYPSEVTFETCRLCDRENCRGRRAPYDDELAAAYAGDADHG